MVLYPGAQTSLYVFEPRYRVCRGTLNREGSESLGGFGTSFVANKGIQEQFDTQAPYRSELRVLCVSGPNDTWLCGESRWKKALASASSRLVYRRCSYLDSEARTTVAKA